jgi:hypothetical protein
MIRQEGQWMGNLIQSKKNLDINNVEIDLTLFNLNIHHYTESLKFNTYLNRKVFIDLEGHIMNAPQLSISFGNINDMDTFSDFKKVVQSETFQELWYSNKSSCEICNVCEFQNMCTDARIPLKRTSKSWYFEKECNYNPFISKWKDDKGYMNLYDCGVKSNSKEFSIDYEKINKIKAQIWD